MERNSLTTALIVCLTVGFLALFTVYLPSQFSEKKLSTAAKPVETRSLSDILKSSPEIKKQWDQLKSEMEKELLEEENLETEPNIPKVTQPSIRLDEVEETTKVHLQYYNPLPKTSLYASGFVFQTPYTIQEMVEFWRNVFGRYEHHHSILHDPNHLDIVFGVLDFSELYENPLVDDAERRRVRSYIEEERKNEIRGLLVALSEGYEPQTPYEKKIEETYAVFREPRKYERGALGLRSQWGQKDRFEEGWIRFGRYREKLEEIFREEGVPPEITRLTFVESMFQLDAISKAGAAGPWQFMPGTAKQFLTIDHSIDERIDPLLAGRAAAQLLRKNYEHVGNWPMAINGYNTGIGRLVKASRKLNTRDIATIINYYQDPGYQFASRNFYPEFLAALEVSHHDQKYFGELTLDQPIPFDQITLPHHTSLHKLALLTGVDKNILIDLNPALNKRVFTKYGFLPSGYTLRIPFQLQELYLATIDLLREEEKNVYWHVVERRESLPTIAQRFKVALNLIRKVNGLQDDQLETGQILKIPGASEEVVLENR